jgi:hypothetical protein
MDQRNPLPPISGRHFQHHPWKQPHYWSLQKPPDQAKHFGLALEKIAWQPANTLTLAPLILSYSVENLAKNGNICQKLDGLESV